MINSFLKLLPILNTRYIIYSIICVIVWTQFTPDTRYSIDIREWNNKLLQSLKTKKSIKPPLKIVLWLNPKLGPKGLKYRRKFAHETIIDPQNKGNPCLKYKHQCEITLKYDNKTLKEADAVIFIEYARPFTMNDLPPNWQQWRSPNQIWAVLIEESPINRGTNLPPVFNWTMSYRRDSEIWHPYGRIYAKNKLDNKIMMGPYQNIPLSKWIRQKSKLVTAAISNCHTKSKREVLVKKIIDTGKQVDIYGNCGNMKNVKKCSYYSRNCTSFWNKIAAEYKFYLAFENSLCQDYITEKFWRGLKFGMVPVVYGGGNYEEIAPPESFINVDKFESAEHLMNYLEKVGGNEEEYAKFFEWRTTFDVVKENKASDMIWCSLFRKLRELKNKQEKGSKIIYQVPTNWWSVLDNSSKFLCTSFDNFLKWK